MASSASVLSAVVLVLFAALIQSSQAKDCYMCTATDGCKDPFKTDGQQTCSDAQSCMKVSGKMNGESVVVRSCLPAQAKEECKDYDQGGVKGTACVCNSNLCNGAGKLTSVGRLELVAILLGSFLSLVVARSMW